MRVQIIKEIISDKVMIKTGADEMIISLLSKALCDFYQENNTCSHIMAVINSNIKEVK